MEINKFSNKNEVLEALRNLGPWEYRGDIISGKWNDDKELALEAIRENLCALGDFSENLCGDIDVILAAIENADTRGLLDTCDYINWTIIGKDRNAILRIMQATKDRAGDDFGYVLFAYNQKYLDEELAGDREFILEAVKIYESILDCASEELQNDPEILGVIENQRKQKEQARQHTSQEIAEGIEPTESAIKEVEEEMIAEQTRDTVEQTNNTEQEL